MLEMPLNQVANIATRTAQRVDGESREKAMVCRVTKRRSIYIRSGPNPQHRRTALSLKCALTDERRRAIIKVVSRGGKRHAWPCRGVAPPKS